MQETELQRSSGHEEVAEESLGDGQVDKMSPGKPDLCKWAMVLC
jgi:hypothetical protein